MTENIVIPCKDPGYMGKEGRTKENYIYIHMLKEILSLYYTLKYYILSVFVMRWYICLKIGVNAKKMFTAQLQQVKKTLDSWHKLLFK